MTEKTIVECDWGKVDGSSCDTATPATETADCPPDWGLFIDGNGKQFHFCPTHARAGVQWCIGGRSEGPLLDISHNYLGESFEEAYAHGETISMTISQLIDEPPREFPDYDHDEHEAWGFHVFDHLYVHIIGQHKGEPTVVVQSDEFPTRLVVDDREDSFIRDDEPRIDRSVDTDTDHEGGGEPHRLADAEPRTQPGNDEGEPHRLANAEPRTQPSDNEGETDD